MRHEPAAPTASRPMQSVEVTRTETFIIHREGGYFKAFYGSNRERDYRKWLNERANA